MNRAAWAPTDSAEEALFILFLRHSLGQESIQALLELDAVEPVDPGVPTVLAPLANVVRTANGVAFDIPEGQTLDIEYSTDLQDWSVIANGVTGIYEDTDAGRLGSVEGYYRARRPE